MVKPQSFSIHKRIETPATVNIPFQPIWFLSFSIHKRIETPATELSPLAEQCSPALSVSTSGSRPLPHIHSTPETRMRSVSLSVSTSGSRPLPHRADRDGRCQVSAFQYPQADRDPCHCVGKHPLNSSKDFQYPQADRDPCHPTFSDHQRAGTDFQYPQADRDPCHLIILAISLIILVWLSVSTSGSRPLPLASEKSYMMLVEQLSVSTSGSRPLPLYAASNQFQQSGTFSIHKRIETPATAAGGRAPGILLTYSITIEAPFLASQRLVFFAPHPPESIVSRPFSKLVVCKPQGASFEKASIYFHL